MLLSVPITHPIPSQAGACVRVKTAAKMDLANDQKKKG